MSQRISQNYILLLLASMSSILYSQSAGDSLFSAAKQAFQLQNFEQAYQDFEQAAFYFSNHLEYDKYIKSLLQMARMTQFTKTVSMSAIPEILQPVTRLLDEDKIERNLVSVAGYFTILGFYHERVSGNLTEARSLFNQGLGICDEVGHPADTQRLMMLIEISRVYQAQQRFDSAMMQAEAAFDLSLKLLGKESPNSASAYYQLADVHHRTGRYDQAEAVLLEGIKILEEINAPPIQIGLGYQNLFITNVAQLDLKAAHYHASRALKIQHQFFGLEHESNAAIYRELGAMYLFVDQPDSAIHYLHKALNIYMDRFGPAYSGLYQIYHHLGKAYTQNHQFDSAISYHLAGLERRRTVAEELWSYINLGYSYVQWDKFPKALEYLEKGEKLARDSLLNKTILRSRLFHTKSQYYYHQDSFLQGAQAWHHSLYELNRSRDHVSYFDYPPIDSFLNLVVGAEHAVFQSESLFNYYRTSRVVRDLEIALSAMQYADRLIDRLRTTYRNSESKIFLQKKARDHYENMLMAAMTGWTRTGDQRYLSHAWQAMEKSRSLLLMEASKSKHSDNFGVPNDLLLKHRNLQDHIAGLEERLIDANNIQDSLLQEYLHSKYSYSWDSLTRIQNEIKMNYPKYFALSNNLTPVALSEVQNVLRSSECFIQFFSGEDHIYRMIVTPDTTCFDQLTTADSIQHILDQWIVQMQSLEFILEFPEISADTINALSKTLFNELLADRYDHLQNFNDWIIIPDQKLGYLSFEALQVKSDAGGDHRYIIEDHTTKYAFSATHYISYDLDHSSLISGKIAGFAPSYQAFDVADAQQDVALQRLYRMGNLALPGAIDEVNAIHSILGGDKYLDKNATEHNFKQIVDDYGLIHLALHGIIDDQNPMFSRLIFNNQDSIEDGYLHAYEVYNLPLKADLVVLSACNTGLGKIEKGEGVMSLSRAFAYAGTPMLVASLWKADDQATRKIMTSFYRQLAKKESVAEALRRAKLEYLTAQKVNLLRHPYFWSSFVFYSQHGDGMSNKSIGLWLMALAGLSLFGLWHYYNKS